MTTTAVNNNVSQGLLDAMNPKSASSTGTSAQDIQDRFMTMLVAQMKNQDPLNPLDNSQVTSQMAQLSTVSGIEILNTTMHALMGNYQTSQNLQAASLIGHGVLLNGSDMALSGGVAGFGVNLASAADKVSVDIYDSAGVKITSVDLGAGTAGINSFTWDGTIDGSSTKASDGSYAFKVTATTQSGSKVDATALQFGMVDNVSFNGNSITLGVRNKGDVVFGDVKQVL